jgi:hypothetical protein
MDLSRSKLSSKTVRIRASRPKTAPPKARRATVADEAATVEMDAAAVEVVRALGTAAAARWR